MAVTDGWTDRTKGAAFGAKPGPRAGVRSLKAALSEAGLGEGASTGRPARRGAEARSALTPADWLDPRTQPFTPSSRSRPLQPRAPVSASAAPPAPAAAYDAEPVVARAAPHHDGVVWPPPLLRAARRGRWRSRLHNAFGWMMALVVAGSIVGVAGQYLAVPLPGLDGVQQARR